jgi:hypothetical protein
MTDLSHWTHPKRTYPGWKLSHDRTSFSLMWHLIHSTSHAMSLLNQTYSCWMHPICLWEIHTYWQYLPHPLGVHLFWCLTCSTSTVADVKSLEDLQVCSLFLYTSWCFCTFCFSQFPHLSLYLDRSLRLFFILIDLSFLMSALSNDPSRVSISPYSYTYHYYLNPFPWFVVGQCLLLILF